MMTEYQCEVCNEYKLKKDCKHCPQLVDRKNDICLANGEYDAKTKNWVKRSNSHVK